MLKENVHFVSTFYQLHVSGVVRVIWGVGACRADRGHGRSGRRGRRTAPLEREHHAARPEVGLELCADVDVRRLPRRVLHDQEQLGHDLEDVSGLEDEITFTLDTFGG